MVRPQYVLCSEVSCYKLLLAMYWHTSAFEPPLHYGTCTYVAGRFGQYQDSSLDMSSIPDHSNNPQLYHLYNLCGQQQHMILR